MHTNAYINAYNVYIILGGQVWPSKICQILLCKSGVWHSKFYLNLGRRLWNLQGTGQTCWRHCTVVQCYQNNWNHVHVCVHTHTYIYYTYTYTVTHVCIYIFQCVILRLCMVDSDDYVCFAVIIHLPFPF